MFAALSFAPSADAGLIAPPSACPNQQLKGGTAKARNAMICMTNYARHRKGLPKYHRASVLNRTASKKAGDILLCGFSHTACGRPFDYWQKRAGYLDSRCWSAGENIAWGSGPGINVGYVFRAWMHSPGHRREILSPSYSDIGVGSKMGKFQGYKGASIWVQHFGSRKCIS